MSAVRLLDAFRCELSDVADQGKPLGRCRDIGIMPCDQLWPEIFDLIIRYNGNLVPLVSDGVRRAFRHNPAVAWPNSPLPADAPEPSGAGPP